MPETETNPESQPEAQPLPERGIVKWFSDQNGFGFIRRHSGSDILVHFTGIVGGGYRSLTENNLVEFDIVESPKGSKAVNVRNLGPAPVQHTVKKIAPLKRMAKAK